MIDIDNKLNRLQSNSEAQENLRKGLHSARDSIQRFMNAKSQLASHTIFKPEKSQAKELDITSSIGLNSINQIDTVCRVIDSVNNANSFKQSYVK